MAERKGGQGGPRPTDGELAILRVIWSRGSATVREVFTELGSQQDVGYTTVLKLMQIMTDKGLLEKDSSVRPQVFRASRPQKQTQKQLLGDLLDRAFSGSPGNLVLQALAMKKSSPEELREIRRLLDELEEGES
ncbi:MAG: BlaI/MecI/CopY family transcriptional regulator [Planctomycetota bacterium]